eukprot:2096647-Prymnesium_polylepis.1
MPLSPACPPPPSACTPPLQDAGASQVSALLTCGFSSCCAPGREADSLRSLSRLRSQPGEGPGRRPAQAAPDPGPSMGALPVAVPCRARAQDQDAPVKGLRRRAGGLRSAVGLSAGPRRHVRAAAAGNRQVSAHCSHPAVPWTRDRDRTPRPRTPVTAESPAAPPGQRPSPRPVAQSAQTARSERATASAVSPHHTGHPRQPARRRAREGQGEV